jgi:hypothetical protein
VWNQALAIWFPILGPARRGALSGAAAGLLRIEAGMGAESVAPNSEIIMSAPRTRARGNEQLSTKKGSETEGAGHSRQPKKSKSSDRTARKSDLGRALRSVYDDTLREAVPDDLLKLIGKL